MGPVGECFSGLVMANIKTCRAGFDLWTGFVRADLISFWFRFGYGRRLAVAAIKISGRNNHRYYLDHRYRINWSRTGICRLCAIPVIPAQVVAGRRPVTTCAGTTGIAQNLNSGVGPSNSIPVVEVISVVIPAADKTKPRRNQIRAGNPARRPERALKGFDKHHASATLCLLRARSARRSGRPLGAFETPLPLDQ